MSRTLIIKTGNLGDVLRTTPILRVLDGEVTWVTSSASMPLLQGNPLITKLVGEGDAALLQDSLYDLVINLEEDYKSAALVSRFSRFNVSGAWLEEQGICYGAMGSEWLNMSRISRLGRASANRRKWENARSYQEIIFSAIGRTFRGEEYVLNFPLQKTQITGLVGIEERVGKVWPNKSWVFYQRLADGLEKDGHQVRFLAQRQSLAEYADDINECEFVISGDTLAMHLGLALKKKVVALFSCTSPQEIYGYGRLEKVVSPMLEQYFYQREYSPDATSSITVAQVEEAFRRTQDSSPTLDPLDSRMNWC
jgi:heptosyltransferase II